MADTLQTVDRALQLVLHLQGTESETVTGAAELLGVAPSVAHRLLTTLESRGFVRRDAGSRAFRLGPAMSGMGPLDADSDYAGIARKPMQWLQAETRETVHLGALHGRSVRFPFAIVSPENMRVESRVGDLLPAHLASVGQALLATLPRPTLHRLYPEQLIGVSTAGRITRDELEHDLALARMRGYSRNIEATELGVTALAMAIVGPGGRPVMAMSVSGPQARLQLDRDHPDTPAERRLVAQLKHAVAQVERALA